MSKQTSKASRVQVTSSIQLSGCLIFQLVKTIQDDRCIKFVTPLTAECGLLQLLTFYGVRWRAREREPYRQRDAKQLQHFDRETITLPRTTGCYGTCRSFTRLSLPQPQKEQPLQLLTSTDEWTGFIRRALNRQSITPLRKPTMSSMMCCTLLKPYPKVVVYDTQRTNCPTVGPSIYFIGDVS